MGVESAAAERARKHAWWDAHRGLHWYDKDKKEEWLKPIFSQLDKAGKVGSVIVDVGSGAGSVVDSLWHINTRNEQRRIILVDVAGRNRTTSRALLEMRFDAEQVAKKSSLAHKKARIRAARFLEIDPRTRERAQADMIVFSEVLNYVDYKKVLTGFAQYLKPGGRFVIINMPRRGFKGLFSKKGLTNTEDLYLILNTLGFTIETKKFPLGIFSGGESESMVVLVAVKE